MYNKEVGSCDEEDGSSPEQAKFHGVLCAVGCIIGSLSSKDMDEFLNNGI